MQGTGIVASSNVITASDVAGMKMKDHRVVILGAGTAGCGVADQICDAFVHDGVSLSEARKQFWLVDRQGLIISGQKGLLGFQEVYARNKDEINSWKGVKNKKNISLLEVVKNIKPTILSLWLPISRSGTRLDIKSICGAQFHALFGPHGSVLLFLGKDPRTRKYYSVGVEILGD